MDSGALFQKKKRKLFVSYDHHRDGGWFEEFTRLFSSLYDITRDNSLARELDSGDSEAFINGLRDDALVDCACMVVLCGAGTPGRKFVDWEIKAALDQGCGLIGVLLPGHPVDAAGQALLPARLGKNFDDGYAVVCRWEDLAAARIDLTRRIIFASARPTSLIDNSLPLRQGNG